MTFQLSSVEAKSGTGFICPDSHERGENMPSVDKTTETIRP